MVGEANMKKAAIIDLEKSIKLCNSLSLYEQMREALFLKSMISSALAKMYSQSEKQKKYEEYSHISESCAKEFNNIDNFIEEVRGEVYIKNIEI
mmetsp:Transcript_22409/g.19913  ORF Transcript_22409/g.19913 Transcript_22409/m.19913 type:complete len:94 (+) Transcript_22409:461-742(+)